MQHIVSIVSSLSNQAEQTNLARRCSLEQDLITGSMHTNHFLSMLVVSIVFTTTV
jgi:hypothetical protein